MISRAGGASEARRPRKASHKTGCERDTGLETLSFENVGDDLINTPENPRHAEPHACALVPFLPISIYSPICAPPPPPFPPYLTVSTGFEPEEARDVGGPVLLVPSRGVSICADTAVASAREGVVGDDDEVNTATVTAAADGGSGGRCCTDVDVTGGSVGFAGSRTAGAAGCRCSGGGASAAVFASAAVGNAGWV